MLQVGTLLDLKTPTSADKRWIFFCWVTQKHTPFNMVHYQRGASITLKPLLFLINNAALIFYHRSCTRLIFHRCRCLPVFLRWNSPADEKWMAPSSLRLHPSPCSVWPCCTAQLAGQTNQWTRSRDWSDHSVPSTKHGLRPPHCWQVVSL